MRQLFIPAILLASCGQTLSFGEKKTSSAAAASTTQVTQQSEEPCEAFAGRWHYVSTGKDFTLMGNCKASDAFCAYDIRFAKPDAAGWSQASVIYSNHSAGCLSTGSTAHCQFSNPTPFTLSIDCGGGSVLNLSK
jgi:hypothetical protein